MFIQHSNVLKVIAAFFVLAAPLSQAAAKPATVLYNDKTTTIEKTLDDPKDLWILPADVTRASGFELKKEGACLGDLCIPIPSGKENEFVSQKDGEKWFNLTALARKMKQAYAADAETGTWSFGPIPPVVSEEMESATAPDFELKDVDGKTHKLSDYRGKKVLILTWATWCGCSMDLPGWEQVYSELKDKNFEIIAAAQDTAGPEVARKPYDRAKATFAKLVDPYHTVSTLYNMVNVPTGVWVNEEGRIVRPGEVAYSKPVALGAIKVDGGAYVDALRDWVEKGDKSIYALKPEELKQRVPKRSSALDMADANFKLGVHFHQTGDKERAEKYWHEAQQLNPDSWNYHRQDWSFTPKIAMKNWTKKVQELDGKPYYAPLELPKAGSAN